MKQDLLTYIHLANPWLADPGVSMVGAEQYIPRLQAASLLNPDWDRYISILTGPRQAGKTTLGRHVCQQLIENHRYSQLLYLNCDEPLVREWLLGSYTVKEMQQLLKSETFILFIDEVQRLDNPGLFLKSIHDLQLPIKLIATGSSQLEIKSKVQEFLTGREIESIILPLSYAELGARFDLHQQVIYGCYPQIVTETEKSLLLQNLYQNYINKDIIEILKIKNADVIRKLLTLIAHSAGQLVNYQQLATDCRVSSHTVQHYLSILEGTYVLAAIKPFVGNKRTEVTSNPIYYFLDNGFRNQALNNFLPLENRTDVGLLIEGAVFQELLKFKLQHYLSLDIHYWRTKGGAEVDFVLYQNSETLIPIEVKYRHTKTAKISRGFASFIDAYQPKVGMMITKDIRDEQVIDGCRVYFIPFDHLVNALALLLRVLLQAG